MLISLKSHLHRRDTYTYLSTAMMRKSDDEDEDSALRSRPATSLKLSLLESNLMRIVFATDFDFSGDVDVVALLGRPTLL